MAEDRESSEASAGSDQTQQPGVTSAELGDEIDRVDPDEVVITTPDEVAPPAGAPDDSVPSVNADLVDEELARALEEASGQQVEIKRTEDDSAD